MKKNIAHRPPLQGQPPELWFRTNLVKFRIHLAPFDLDISAESARIPAIYGSGDPGDCFLLATAHVAHLTLVTRDARILSFAEANPTYLSVIAC